MENTLHNKAKFFSLFLWQKVWVKPPVYGYDTFVVNPEMLYSVSSDEYLSLKPISSITDEDLIHVARLSPNA